MHPSSAGGGGGLDGARLKSSSLQAVTFGNEALRGQHRYEDEPFRTRWECLHAAEDCTAIAYDYRGIFLAIGTREGLVSGRGYGGTGCGWARRGMRSG
jgi:hypothetical protein